MRVPLLSGVLKPNLVTGIDYSQLCATRNMQVERSSAFGGVMALFTTIHPLVICLPFA